MAAASTNQQRRQVAIAVVLLVLVWALFLGFHKSAAAPFSWAPSGQSGQPETSPPTPPPVHSPTTQTQNAPPLGVDPAHDDYVAICLAVKDQGLDLPEFLQHHHYNIGINRIYIMDDGSNPPLSTLQHTYGVPSDVLRFVYYPPEQHAQGSMQYKIYDACVHEHSTNSTWLALIDADEFFDTPGKESLHDILRGLEPLTHIGGLGVNWQTHTSSGRLTRAESVRSTYQECIYDDTENDNEGTDNAHIKSIVRRTAYERPMNPHKFAFKDGAVTVGEKGDTIEHYALRKPITRDRIALHHYAVKSREEYEEKIHRSNAVNDPKGWDFWDHIEGLPHVPCPEMARWVEGQK